MKKVWLAASAALLLAAPGAYAGVGEGDIEAGLSVSLVTTEIEIEGSAPYDSDVGIIEASGGYFFTDSLEAKLALSMLMSTDSTLGTIEPGVDYLFFGPNSGSVIPFVGAAYALGLSDTPTDYLDVHGGVKYFFRENTSVEAKLSYQSPTDSEFDGTTDVTVGINVYF